MGELHLLRPLFLWMLVPAVLIWFGVRGGLAPLRRLQKEIARRDELTELYNDRYLHRRLSKIIHEAVANNTECGIIFLDLDHFKQVNDSHGHLVGSRLLSEVGATLKPWAYVMWPVLRMGMFTAWNQLCEEFQHYVETGTPHPRKVAAIEKARSTSDR